MPATLQARTRTRLAERLQALDRERYLTMADLAKKVGINRTTLHKWRSSRYVPSKALATLIALADEFGVATDWLLGRTNDRNGDGLPCRECARGESELAKARDELAEMRAELAKVRTERHELRARLVAALAAHPEPPKAARPEPVDDHDAVAARVAALKAAKVAKYASAGREGLSPEEMDAVLQGASS